MTGALDSLIAQLGEGIARSAGVAQRAVVLIDGGSGSGKTTLAALLAPAIDAQLVRLDDFYPGWDGLEQASRMVHDDVLSFIDPGWRRWDWVAAAPAEWHPLDPLRSLVIEGSGSLSQANRARASYGIWLDLDEASRKRRALERDGETYAPHWERWAEQERAFFARERPDLLADAIIDARQLPADAI